MAYSELIKDFARIRDYMREFYVYGFKSREEYDAKSARSYDNERRRIQSWLGEHLAFRQDASGKAVFLSVDSRRIPANPLYKAFKAKSFTAKDITLHFYLLDILADGAPHSYKDILDAITQEYLSHFSGDFTLDESTVRKKLREYQELGLLQAEKQGREVFYRRAEDGPSLASWREALAFYSEADPLGVIGSFLLDRLGQAPALFRFKHHYILHALDSDILCQLLLAIDQQRAVELEVHSLRSGSTFSRTVCPLKIYVSAQTGRQYLLGYFYRARRMIFYRLDTIKKASPGAVEPKYARYLAFAHNFDQNLWGVSAGPEADLDHIEMTLRIGPGEEHIFQRLEREKRHGTVERLSEDSCRFSADVYDASEMLPWLRTFTGRITSLRCSRPFVVELFREDLARMEALYGGDAHAVS